MPTHVLSVSALAIGDVIRVRRSLRSPYSTEVGTVSSIDPNDQYGVYLVKFEDGLQFRYGVSELELISTESKGDRSRYRTPVGDAAPRTT